MATRADVVTEARSFIGTPYLHQARVKGKGIDCDNFVAAVAEATGAAEGLDIPNDYRRQEDGSVMLALLDKHLDFIGVELESALPGDVIALTDSYSTTTPRHLAFFSQHDPYPKMVHASERGVREHRIDAHFARLIHSIWRIRGLSD